tara:strand:+ start:317 stop:544 length:228 start_codon:yes stop_codon:yes gene_type:complete
MNLNNMVCNLLKDYMSDITKWMATKTEVRVTIPDVCTPSKLMLERTLHSSEIVDFQAVYDLSDPNYITYKIRRSK